MTFTTDLKTLERLREYSTGKVTGELCPNGHSTYQSRQYDLYYCAECDKAYGPEECVSYNPMLED